VEVAPVIVALLLVACGPKDPILQPDRTSLDFLVVDDGNDQLHRVDELRGNDWTLDLPQGSRDLVAADAEHVLVSHGGGAWLVNVADGEVERKYEGLSAIISAMPQPQDAALLFTNQAGALRAYSFDRNGEETAERTFVGYNEVRIVREIANDYLLFTSGEPWRMFEIDGLGNVIFSVSLPWRGHQAIKNTAGNYMVSITDRLLVREFTRQSAVVRTIDGNPVAEEYNLVWFSGFDEVPSAGLTVVANWLAMADDPSVGAHLVAFDTAGEVAWTWEDHTRAGTVTAVQVLEAYVPD
jgi:hypothetical protein